MISLYLYVFYFTKSLKFDRKVVIGSLFHMTVSDCRNGCVFQLRNWDNYMLRTIMFKPLAGKGKGLTPKIFHVLGMLAVNIEILFI